MTGDYRKARNVRSLVAQRRRAISAFSGTVELEIEMVLTRELRADSESRQHVGEEVEMIRSRSEELGNVELFDGHRPITRSMTQRALQ
jgi:hypothetical protein